MIAAIDERQQQHIYSCLLVGNNEFQKVKKSLAKLDRTDDEIDEEIAINANLRRLFNPRADEEARERERAKRDPQQMDLTESASSGETGGGRPAGERVVLTPDPAPTDAELRDSLRAIDCVVSLGDVRGWSAADRAAVVTWVGQVVAAHTIGGMVPDEPDCLAAVAMSIGRQVELLAMGPYGVQAAPEPDDHVFEVVHAATHEVDGTLVDRDDADLRAARLNRGLWMNADITDEEIAKWSAAGPWSYLLEANGTATITTGTDTELCASLDDAIARAARYNRTIAGREWDGSYPLVRVSDDAAEEIIAAAAAEGDPE